MEGTADFLFSSPHDDRSAKKASVSSLEATIKDLEQRIQEIESEQMVSSASKKVQELIGDRKPTFTLKDIMEGEQFNHTEEETDGKRSTLKSGYDMKNQAKILNEVQWPHGFLSKLQHVTNTKPDSLSIEAFVYGYITILLQTKDEQEMKGRLQHAKQLMWHSLMHGWSSARAFHYQVLRELEMDNFTWEDQHEMAMMSLSAAHENSTSLGTIRNNSRVRTERPSYKSEDNAVPTTDRRSICCYLYNNDVDGCRFEKTAEGCKKLHACSICVGKGFLNKHPARECKK